MVTGSSPRRDASRTTPLARAGARPACHESQWAGEWMPQPFHQPASNASATIATKSPWAAFTTPLSSATRPSNASTSANDPTHAPRTDAGGSPPLEAPSLRP